MQRNRKYKDEKIEMPNTKTKNKKRAKVYKNSVAASLTETIILSAFFLP